jgi:ankyrin repeat protein
MASPIHSTLMKRDAISDLKEAERARDLPVVQKIFDERKGDISEKDFIDVLTIALQEEQPAMVKYLLDNAKDDRKEAAAKNPSVISMAITSGSTECVQPLLDAKMEINPKIDPNDIDAQTPLGMAITAQHVDLVRLLLEKGADPNVNFGVGNPRHTPGPKSGTPLDFAAQVLNLDILKLLLDHKAVIRRSAVLHWAVKAELGDFEKRKKFVEAVLDVDKDLVNVIESDSEDKDFYKEFEDLWFGTPLHRAVGRKDVKMVDLLLQRGARKDIRMTKAKKAPGDGEGKTPLELANATTRKKQEIIDLLSRP